MVEAAWDVLAWSVRHDSFPERFKPNVSKLYQYKTWAARRLSGASSYKITTGAIPSGGARPPVPAVTPPRFRDSTRQAFASAVNCAPEQQNGEKSK